MSKQENIDLDSFFADFKNDFNEKINENNQKIADQIAQAKEKAIKEIDSIEPTTDQEDEVEVEEKVEVQETENNKVTKPIVVKLPEIYNRIEPSLTEESNIADHLAQHWGF